MGDRRGALVRFYAALAVVGAVLPYMVFVPWVARHGFDPPAFFRLPFANGPAAIFSIDVLFSAAVFILWQQVEARRIGIGLRWLPPVVTVTVGLCCALPLFLAMRERTVAEARI